MKKFKVPLVIFVILISFLPLVVRAENGCDTSINPVACNAQCQDACLNMGANCITDEKNGLFNRIRQYRASNNDACVKANNINDQNKCCCFNRSCPGPKAVAEIQDPQTQKCLPLCKAFYGNPACNGGTDETAWNTNNCLDKKHQVKGTDCMCLPNNPPNFY